MGTLELKLSLIQRLSLINDDDLLHRIKGLIDRMEEIIDGFFNELDDGVKVFLGNDNPFGSFLGTLILKKLKYSATSTPIHLLRSGAGSGKNNVFC